MFLHISLIFSQVVGWLGKLEVELISNRVYLTFTHPRLILRHAREEAAIIKSGRGVTTPFQLDSLHYFYYHLFSILYAVPQTLLNFEQGR